MSLSKKQLNKFQKAIRMSGYRRVWIATQLGITKGHLTNMLSGRDKFLEKHRKKLNEILQTNF